MDASIPVRPTGQRVPSASININDLSHAGSIVMRAAATTAATLLVIASAGFGATFALSQASHHGPGLVAFALAMAIGLEICKPFAIEGVFSCLRVWAIGRALAMAALGLVAVAYSLTAELSLMAATRGDAAAERTRATDTAKDDRAELARLTAERSAMPAFGPATADAVTAGREAVTSAASVRAAECGKRGPQCRAREADEGVARAALAKVISDKAATDRAGKLDMDAAKVRTRLAKASPVAAAADPGAAALASYLATFGLSMPPGMVSEWMVLIGVVALELGSALSVVLVRAAGGASHRSPRQSASVDSDAASSTVDTEAPAPHRGAAATARHEVSKSPKHTPLDTPARARGRTAKGRRLGSQGKVSTLGQSASGVSKVSAAPVARGQAQARIVDTLKDAGGKLDGASVRGIAALIGGKRSTVHAALATLLASGVVAKVGTALVLTAAA